MAESKREVFQPDEYEIATRHRNLANRVAYLEGRCLGINALRGE